MTLLPTDIPTGLVTGQFYFVNEDNVDGDTNPELTVVQGDVIFTCSAPLLRMPTKLASVVPLEFKAKFDSSGNLVSASDPTVGLKLPATDSSLISPTGFTWHVDFSLVQVSNRHSIVIKPFDFQVPAGTTVDLTTVMPVSTAAGTLTVQGPQGIQGPTGATGATGATGPTGPATTDASLLTTGTVADARLPVSAQAATLSATYAPAQLGTRQSPILSRKIRGGNIAPKPGGYGWQGLFAEWDWNNWIKPQVDRLIALGGNAIRLIGAPRCIFVDPIPGTLLKITQTQYDAHWAQLADYCLRNGLYLYPTLVSKWDFIDTYGIGANFQDAPMTNSIKTTAGVLSAYSNVIGFDLFQEGDAGTAVAWAASTAYVLNALVNNGGKSYKVTTAGTSAASGGPTGTGSSITDGTVTWAYQGACVLPADVLALMTAVRTTANVPLTMSRSLSDGFGWSDTTSMWYTVFNTVGGADFIDLHLYLDGILPGDPDFLLLKSGKPFLIGEFGSQQSISSGTQTARFQAVAAIHNRRGAIGSFVWALADQDTVTSNQWGVWDNTGYTAPAFPGASTAPLSVTTGKRTTLTSLLPTFTIADKFELAYKPQNMLSATQARPRNSATLAGTGWLGGSNTYLYAEPRGLGFSATATGTTFAAISMANSWRVPVAGATYYQGKIVMLAGATARTVSFNIDWYDSSGTYITSSTAATGTDSTTVPLTLNLLVRSHTNAVYAVLIAKVTDATQVANEAHIVTEAELLPAQ